MLTEYAGLTRSRGVNHQVWSGSHGLGAGPGRSGPISMRSATDLDAEYDRSRAGTRPISTRLELEQDGREHPRPLESQSVVQPQRSGIEVMTYRLTAPPARI